MSETVELSTEVENQLALEAAEGERRLSGYTIPQLVAYANEKVLVVPKNTNKADLVASIVNAEHKALRNEALNEAQDVRARERGFVDRKEAWEFDWTMDRIETAIEAGKAAEAKFAADVARNGLLVSLEWAGNAAEAAASAKLAKAIVQVELAIRENGETNPLVALRAAIDKVCVQPLVRNEWRGSSTSAFSNAVEAATCRAAATIARG